MNSEDLKIEYIWKSEDILLECGPVNRCWVERLARSADMKAEDFKHK